MSNSVQLLKIFHTGFLVCLVLAVLLLIVSAVLFFRFDIRGIWTLRSGKAKARAIQEKQQEAALSGKLRTGKKAAPELLESGELETPATVKVQTASSQLREGTELTTALKPDDRPRPSGKFIIERQILYIHTEESI